MKSSLEEKKGSVGKLNTPKTDPDISYKVKNITIHDLLHP